MIPQERTPGLGRRLTSSNQILGNGGLPDFNTELQQFPVDARCAPERVGRRHRADQHADLERHGRASHATSAPPRPDQAEPSTVPSQDGLGFDDHERRSPFMPHARDPNPEEAVRTRQAQPSRAGPLEHVDLVTQREQLEVQRGARAQTRPKREQERDENRHYRGEA